MSRMRSRFSAVLALAAAALVTVDVGGFGEAGHRVVGRVAEVHLGNARAMEEVRKILRPKESLADASVWPDTIKNVTYEDEDTGPFRLEHPAHDVYHFTNLPFQAERYEASAMGAHWVDIVRMLGESIRVLKGSSTVFSRREALRLLAHLVGDIHQPLHVGTGFVSAQGPPAFIVPGGATGWRPSLGGNALRYGPNDNFNLHSYWDSHVVNLAMQRQDVAGFAASLVRDLAVLPAWSNSGDVESWPALWATEALGLAREAHAGVTITAYLGPDQARGTAHRWRIDQAAGYDTMARARVRVQLAKGGHRLAATLTAIWPDAR